MKCAITAAAVDPLNAIDPRGDVAWFVIPIAVEGALVAYAKCVVQCGIEAAVVGLLLNGCVSLDDVGPCATECLNPINWVKAPGAKIVNRVGKNKPKPRNTPVRFERWKPGDAIDKPLPDGSPPDWDTVRKRYWKNRHDLTKDTGEFGSENLDRMRRGDAPLDYNSRTGQLEPRELHHHVPQRDGGPNNPINLRELTPDQHRRIDPHRR